MDFKAKAPVISIILILVSLSLAGTGFYLLQQERAKSMALQEKVDELETKYRISEAKLMESQKIAASLGVKVKDITTQIETLSNELQQEKSTKEEALGKIEQMKVDLEQQKSLRSDLEKKLNDSQEEVKKIQDKLVALESQKIDLEAKAKEAEAKIKVPGVELGKIEVNKGLKEKKLAEPVKKEEPPVLKALEGKILVVNKEYGFAVINLGSKDKVGMGDTFAVYQGNQAIGDIKVEKLHDSMAAAGFTSEDIKDKIREGDKVVKKS
ncbi:MAG: hypothetical protein NTW13_06505 [Candidatus Omnitrophica bacterium]|nr:hypothetical protein [Candidatus Omnitrophota bacterium]